MERLLAARRLLCFSKRVPLKAARQHHTISPHVGSTELKIKLRSAHRWPQTRLTMPDVCHNPNFQP